MSDEDLAIKYVGIREDEATVQAYNDGWDVVRITQRDSNAFVVTRDYRMDRINFIVERNFVVRVSVG